MDFLPELRYHTPWCMAAPSLLPPIAGSPRWAPWQLNVFCALSVIRTFPPNFYRTRSSPTIHSRYGELLMAGRNNRKGRWKFRQDNGRQMEEIQLTEQSNEKNSTPRIIGMLVIPVAGKDSML